MQNIINLLSPWSLSLSQYAGLAPLTLRLAIASIFIVHGKSKLTMWKMQPSDQMPLKMLNIMKALSIFETLGGLAILSGFLTPFASIGLGIIMIGAIYFKIFKWKIGFASQQGTGWEFDLMVLAGCATLAMSGAGDIS